MTSKKEFLAAKSATGLTSVLLVAILLAACGGDGGGSTVPGPVKAWGSAQLIETDNAGSAVQPQIAIDPNGNALAVWQQSDGTRDNIWANRFE